MQPENPIPLDYRHALRWLSWKAGNNYSVLRDSPESFAMAYRTWNQLIDVASVRATTQIAEQAAIRCLEKETTEKTPARDSIQFNDFRDGVCEVADRLAGRQFSVGGDFATDPELWQMGGSELEMIFAIYMNNVAVTPGLVATNHTYAMSRLELYFKTYNGSNPLEEWECDHDPLA